MRLGGFRGRLRSGVGRSKWSEPAALALGAMQEFLSASKYADIGKIACIEEQTVDAARSGIARDGSAVAGGRICGHRTRPGRYGAGAWHPHSAGDVVPVSAGGETARGAACWCWAKSRMRNRARRWCWSVHPLHAKTAGESVLRGFTFEARRDGSLRRLVHTDTECANRQPQRGQRSAAWEAEMRA